MDDFFFISEESCSPLLPSQPDNQNNLKQDKKQIRDDDILSLCNSQDYSQVHDQSSIQGDYKSKYPSMTSEQLYSKIQPYLSSLDKEVLQALNNRQSLQQKYTQIHNQLQSLLGTSKKTEKKKNDKRCKECGRKKKKIYTYFIQQVEYVDSDESSLQDQEKLNKKIILAQMGQKLKRTGKLLKNNNNND